MLKFVRLSAVAAMMLASTAWAGDTASMREEIADLRAKVASLESAEMAPSASGEAASLTSMKGKGAITIGGTAEWPIIVAHADENVLDQNMEDDEVDNTWAAPELALNIRVQASKDMALNVKLDVEDTAEDEDLIEEMYFEWKNVGGSPISLNLGKKEVSFGQDAAIGYHDMATHGNIATMDGTYLHARNEADTTVVDNNAHNAQPYSFGLPGEIDNTVQIEAIYAYKELLKVYFTVFQNSFSDGGNEAWMHEDRASDHFGFESMALKLELTPIEGLELSFSAVNIHDDSAEAIAGDDNTAKNANEQVKSYEDDMQAISLAGNYKFKRWPVQIFGEWLHGWNLVDAAPVNGGTFRFDDRLDSDTIQLGLIWGVTENIDLGIAGEYVNVDRDGALNATDDTVAVNEWEEVEYWQLGLSAYYNFDNGMYMGLEYYHTWMDAELDDGGAAGVEDDFDADADMIGFVMGYSF